MSLVLDEHREYLSDAPRLDAFRRAIHATVRPGDIVLDLACGTGILGLMACEAGAAHVYAIDSSEMIEIARAVARHNGLADRITHVGAYSTSATIPVRADVLVFDQMGHLGFNAGLLEFAADARARLLKPGARIVPGPVTLEIALASSPVMRARAGFWDTRPAGFDFSMASVTARNSGYPVEPQNVRTISGQAAAMTFRPAEWRGEPLVASFQLAADAAGTADGLCGWFRAELAPGVWMTNAPAAADRINRRPAFLPFDRPLPVNAGDRFDVTMRVLPADSILTWEIARADGTDRMAHSTWKGLLPMREVLSRTREDAVPTLSEAGVARKSVLELCDGRRTVREIEAAVRARHPQLLTDDQAAAVFVAEVLAVYGRA